MRYKVSDEQLFSADPARQLALVMGHMRHGVVVYDRDERICLINVKVSEIFGFDRRLIVAGSTLSEYLTCIGRAVGWSPERIVRILANHRAWRKAGDTRTLDHYYDNGSVLEITFCPVEHGATVLTFADVTHARRQAKASVQREELTRRASTMIDTVARLSSRNRIVAFNASIEAARLGEQGRGFAVVADEVRDLSRQMSEALDDIGRVIEASLDGV